MKPSDAYDTSEWLFVPDHYTEYRYVLGTKGKKPLICMGVNPSTAAPGHLDPTLQSVQRIALNNGFDSFLMMNVYAQRATSPRDVDSTCHQALHRENLEAFRYLLSLSEKPAVWAAWGNIIEMRPYLPACLLDLIDASRSYQAIWLCCGAISKKGHPHHPLYLKKDAPLVPFDIDAYALHLRSAAKERKPKKGEISMPIRLIQATIADAEKMWQMQLRAFSELLVKYQDADTSPGNETLEKVKAKIGQEGSAFYFIEENGNAVGGIRIKIMPDAEKRISPLFILPEQRNRGLAQQAILAAEAIYGKDHWALETILEEKGNCHLYEKMGYISTGKTEPVNDRLTLILYTK